MIITRIDAGLGNQMFQYAAGLSVATRTGSVLKIDNSIYDASHGRSFALEGLSIADLKVASLEEISELKKDDFFYKVKNRVIPTSARTIFKETHFHFHENFLKLTDPVYLKGFWQSEKYFDNVSNIIRQEFVVHPSHLSKVKDIADKISLENSISVHIRRGDYLNPVFTNYHGILSKENYYDKAIKEIIKKVDQPKFYFFSDDIEWVKEVFEIEGAVYVSGDFSSNHYEDLFLMSQCKHNIIANSSFSWWGAWLNHNPDKIVIAPKKWFNKSNNNTRDLIPPSWIKL